MGNGHIFGIFWAYLGNMDIWGKFSVTGVFEPFPMRCVFIIDASTSEKSYFLLHQ